MPVALLNALRRDALAAAGRCNLVQAVKPVEEAGGTILDTYNTDKTDINTHSVNEFDMDPAPWAQVMTVPQLRAAQRCGISHIIVEETPEIMKALTEEERKACIWRFPLCAAA